MTEPADKPDPAWHPPDDDNTDVTPETEQRVEKGEPAPDDVNPPAPPVNIQGGA